jgi:hypothetical protein
MSAVRFTLHKVSVNTGLSTDRFERRKSSWIVFQTPLRALSL